MKNDDLIEVGKISRANSATKVIRDGEEIELSVGDTLYFNDVVHNNDFDIFMDFSNGKEFFLESNQEVLLDEYFLPVKETIDDDEKPQEPQNIQTDAIEQEPHPYYVTSHDEKDIYLERDDNMVDINAKVADATLHNSDFTHHEDENIRLVTPEAPQIIIPPMTNKDPIIIITGQPGSTVILHINGHNVGPVPIPQTGTIHYQIPPGIIPPNNPNITIYGVLTGTNGLHSPQSIPQPIGIDTLIDAQDDLQTTDEDTPMVTGNVLTNDDHTHGETVTTTGDIAGTHGIYHLNPNGSYTYKLNNSLTNHLAAGESVDDTITYKITDKAGNTTTAQLTTHIIGTNDEPILTINKTSNTTSGSLTETDADTNDTHTFTTPNGQGTYGDLTVNPNGTYTFTQNQTITGMTLDPTTGIYSGKQYFEVHVDDNHGGQDLKFIEMDVFAQVLNINGIPTVMLVPNPNLNNVPPLYNQLPPLGQGTPPLPIGPGSTPIGVGSNPQNPQPPVGPGTGSNQNTNPNGVTIDLDSGSDSGKDKLDNLTNVKNPMITGHTLIPNSEVIIYDNGKEVARGHSNANGDYLLPISLTTEGVHNLTATAQDLSSVTPTTSQPLDVTLDTSLNVHDDTANITEDGATNVILGNVLTNDDHAKGETLTTTGDVAGKFGTFHFNQDGTYTYTLDNSKVQNLADGQTTEDKITYSVTDPAGNVNLAHLAVTITGTNDGPVAVADTGKVAENLSVTVDVLTNDTDVDDNHTFTLDKVTAPKGTVSVVNNELVFEANAKDFDHLAFGKTEQVTVTYEMTDENGAKSTSTAVITITGTNDNPVLGVTQTNNNTGTLTQTDVDDNDTHTFIVEGGNPQGTLNGTFGSLHVDPKTGVYSYVQHPDVTGMAYDKTTGTYTGQETFKVEVTDNHEGVDVKFITFNPSATMLMVPNPAYIVGVSGPLVPQNIPQLTPSITTPPQLTPQAPTNVPSITPPTNTPPTIDLIATDDTRVSHKDDITKDDTPTIKGEVPIPFSQVTIYDGAKNPIITVTADKDGHYKVILPHLDDNVHTLHVESVPPHTPGVTPVASPDLPVTIDTTLNTQDDTVKIDEDDKSVTGNVITNDDHGNGEKVTAETIVGQYGTYTLKSNGEYTYTLDNKNPDVQALAVGETLSDPITYTVTDIAGNSKDVPLITTVHGTNDIPVLSVTSNSDNITGTLTETDVDTSDKHTFTVVHGAGTFGTLHVDPDTGKYTYSQNQDVNGMNYDPATKTYSGQETFEVKVDDHNGGVVSKFITFNPEATVILVTNPALTGTGPVPDPLLVPPLVPQIVPAVNQVPQVGLTPPTNVPSLTPPTNVVTIDLPTGDDTGIKDDDNITKHDTPTIHVETGIPFSHIEIFDGKSPNPIAIATADKDGNYNVPLPQLPNGDHPLVAQVTPPGITNPTPIPSQPLALVIDTSIAASNDTQDADEDIPQIKGNVLTNDDHTDGETVVSTGIIKGKHGTYTLDENGDYTYKLDHSETNHLAVGESVDDTIKYQITDKAGNTTTATLTTHIIGTNDDPVLSVTQATNNTGTLSETDVDTSDTHVFTVAGGNPQGTLDGTFGSLHVDPSTGKYSYVQHPDVTGMAYDKTTSTYSGHETFEVKVDDGNGGVVSKFITFDPTATMVMVTNPAYTAMMLPGGTPNLLIPQNIPQLTPNITTPPQVNPNAPINVPSITPPTNTPPTIDLMTKDDTGISHIDNITNHNTPTIQGQVGIPFSQVTIYDGAKNPIITVTADKNGHYEVPLPKLQDAVHNLHVESVPPHAPGATPVPSGDLPVTIDTSIDASTIDITDGNTADKDDVINAVESHHSTITGTIDPTATLTSLIVTDANGHKVTIDVTDPTKVTVDANGHFTATGVDVSTLADGKLSAISIAKDPAGNISTEHDEIILDTVIPPIPVVQIPPFTNDQTPDVIVTPPKLPVGSVLVVHIPGGATYEIPVPANQPVGQPWNVPLHQLPEGQYTPTFEYKTPHENISNPLTPPTPMVIDVTPPTISIDVISKDEVVNAHEHKHSLLVRGTTDAEVGQTVTVELNKHTYTGTVVAGGTFSIDIPKGVIHQLIEGTQTLTPSVQDKAGNNSTPNPKDFNVDTQADIKIDAISTDDVINSLEHTKTLDISGKVTGVEDSQTVTIHLGTHDYTASVTNGKWTANVPAADVTALATGNATVSASVSDVAGNLANATHPVLVTDAFAGLATVDITDAGTDDVINKAESTNAVITGTMDPTSKVTHLIIEDTDGNTVDVVVDLSKLTVTPTGNYSISGIDVSSLKDGILTVRSTIEDKVGNTTEVTDTVSKDILTTVDADLTSDSSNTFDTIPSQTDDITNINTPTITGMAEAGASIVITDKLNNIVGTGTADASGKYSIDTSILKDGDRELTITSTDKAGNTATAVQNINVDTVNNDWITARHINIAGTANTASNEISFSGITTLGSVLHIYENGNEIKTIDASVAKSGPLHGLVTFSENLILPQGVHNITFQAEDIAGNLSKLYSENLVVDTVANAGITIEDITSDNIINATESGAKVEVKGTVSGDVSDGDIVTLTVNGKDYTGAVTAGTYKIEVDGSDLAADTNVDAAVTGTDTHGNSKNATANHAYTVDTTANVTSAPTVTITEDINDDGTINKTELSGDVDVSVSIPTGAVAGDIFNITVNGVAQTAVTIDATMISAGKYTFTTPSPGEGNAVKVKATITDAQGNVSVEGSDLATIDTTAGTITLDEISNDILDATERGQDLTITGTTTGIETGQIATVEFNGKPYIGTVKADGTFSVTVPAVDVALLTDTITYTATANVSDKAGNAATPDSEDVHTTDTTAGTITLEEISGDIIEAAERGQELLISGTTTGIEDNQTVTVHFNGNDYKCQVFFGLFQVKVPASDIATLTDSTIYTATANVSDAAGNPAPQASEDVHTTDTTPPVPTISLDHDITHDDIINASESKKDIAVTGHVGGDAKVGDTVTLTVNGNDYTGTVKAGNTFSIDVPGSALVADGDKIIDASISITDAAGNIGKATDTEAYSVDTTAVTAPTVTIPEDWDNNTVLTNREVNGSTNIRIDIPADAKVGDILNVTIDGKTSGISITQVMIDYDYLTSVTPPAEGVTLNVSATITDAAGNTSLSSSDSVTRADETAPTPTIDLDNITSDNKIDSSENNARSIPVTGTVRGEFNAGDKVTLDIFKANGDAYSSTVDAHGHFSINVPGSVLASNHDKEITATIETHDAAGNVGSAHDDQAYTVEIHTAPTIDISVRVSNGHIHTSTSQHSSHHTQPDLNVVLDQWMQDLLVRWQHTDHPQEHTSFTRTSPIFDNSGRHHDGAGDGIMFTNADTIHKDNDVIMQGGNDFLYFQGKLTDLADLYGDFRTGSHRAGQAGNHDVLVLGSYSSHDLEKTMVRHGRHYRWEGDYHIGNTNTEIAGWEHILTSDNVWIKGGPSSNTWKDVHPDLQQMPTTFIQYEYDITLGNTLPESGDHLKSVHVSKLPTGMSLVDANGDKIIPDSNGVYNIDTRHTTIKLVSDHDLTNTPPDFQVDMVVSHSDGRPDTHISQGGGAPNTALLIDGTLEGVEYETTSGLHGFTDADGSYSFNDGDTITFKVGGVVLGSVTAAQAASGQTFLQDIANIDRADLNNEYLENMATLLQSLDSDSSDNIKISQAMIAALKDANIDLRTATEAEVKALVESVGAKFVDEESAMEHVQDMLEKYTDMAEGDFDKHIDDSLQSASLVTSATAGVEYTTSSGLTGVTDENGEFTYLDGDTIKFKDADGNVISEINQENIGDDGVITFQELQDIQTDKLVESSVDSDTDADISDADEAILSLVDDSDENQDMPSLDNIGDQLAAKSVEVVIPTEALATAATLLQDTIVTTDDTNVIKSVENQEPKEPVKNPDAPVVPTDENGVEIAEQDQAEFIPDVHNQMPQDDENDGTGITS